jgi:hypothetical protein
MTCFTMSSTAGKTSTRATSACAVQGCPNGGGRRGFDLLLRAGALGVGGSHYLPELAYLLDSTGPRRGFEAVFGGPLSDDRAPWGEAVLQTWARHWGEVADRVGVDWEGDLLYPCDQENFLCIYQGRLGKKANLR